MRTRTPVLLAPTLASVARRPRPPLRTPPPQSPPPLAHDPNPHHPSQGPRPPRRRVRRLRVRRGRGPPGPGIGALVDVDVEDLQPQQQAQARNVTVVSDIDGILRVTRNYKPKDGLLDSFANALVPWLDMPSVYAEWARQPDALTSTSLHPRAGDAHLHGPTSTAPTPRGSFDTRPLNFSDVSATLSICRFLLDRVSQTFPDRRFVLVGDTSNSDVMKAYSALVRDYPGQVACILLRNTSATDSDMLFPYYTDGFRGLNQSFYMFFRTPDDLRGIHVTSGNRYNTSVPQNVTFGY